MQVAFSPEVRVSLAVVALGTPQRLKDCLDSLAAHQSRHDFTVVCVVNPAAGDATVDLALDFPPHVLVVPLDVNVGWPGGLHIARSRVRGEYLVWVQEDMVVLDGWLDALVDAADAHPEFAAFGSHAVDEAGNATGISGGRATPAADVAAWNQTDTTHAAAPVGVVQHDWVTSKGMLTRLAAWDEIGGANPTYYPLNHVDKDYSMHLRAHGLAVALVGEARLRHLQSQSAPSMFRRFISEFRDPQFNATWGSLVEQLATGPAVIEHDCKPWFPGLTQTESSDAQIEHVAAVEASTMLIAFAKWATRFTDASIEHQRNVDNHALSVALAEQGADLRAQLEAAQAAAQAYERTLSWRLTRPLRALRRLTSGH